MGTWGIGILENDLSADVYGDFFDLFDDGFEPVVIHEKLLEAYEGELEVNDHRNFWLGLAQAEWECGYQNTDTLENVKDILRDEGGNHTWEDETRDERRKVLVAFFERISTPASRPRQREEKRVERTTFPEGTCLAVRLNVGGFGAAIVLRNESRGTFVYTLIGGLKGVFGKVPSMVVFEKREWLFLTHHNFKNQLHVVWCDQEDLEENRDEIIVIGATAIRDSDPVVHFEEPGVGHAGIGWVENQIWMQDQAEKESKGLQSN